MTCSESVLGPSWASRCWLNFERPRSPQHSPRCHAESWGEGRRSWEGPREWGLHTVPARHLPGRESPHSQAVPGWLPSTHPQSWVCLLGPQTLPAQLGLGQPHRP